MSGRRAVVVGIYEYPERVVTDRSALQIEAECARRALEDAGLTPQDVDGFFHAGSAPVFDGVLMAEYLGIHPRYTDTTGVGGSSYEFHVNHAAMAIAAGKCDVALITYGSTAFSNAIAIGTGSYTNPVTPANEIELPHGLALIGDYAMVAQRHSLQYGTTPEQRAEIAVAIRKNASRNPHARYRDPITIEDVLNSRMVADPLRVLECCIICDGGGAVALTAAERARDLRKPPVLVLGAGEAIKYTAPGEDITVTAGKESAARAFGEAGLTPDDVDMCMIYDSFTITVLCALEDMGFCKKGEGGDFVSGGRLAYDGGLPVNTDGGGLSSNHSGMRGLFLIIEAVRQLRGESTAQVPNCRVAVAHGVGGFLTSRHACGTVLLGRE